MRGPSLLIKLNSNLDGSHVCAAMTVALSYRVDREVEALVTPCSLYGFVLESALMGSVILVGLVANTIAGAVLWQERALAAPVFLLQATLVADTAVLWMLFIGEAVPSLAYVIPVLQDCSVVCHYIYCITRPLLFLAQICSVAFVLWALINRYIVLCRPTLHAKYSEFGFARKQTICTIFLVLLFALPMTMDTVVKIHMPGQELDNARFLIDNVYYFSLYINGVVFMLFFVLPILAIVYYSFKLARVVQSVRHLRRILEPGFKRENVDVTQVMLAIGTTVFVCYVPHIMLTVTQLVDAAASHTHCGDLQYYLHGFSNLFIAINSSTKLFLLCFFARRFRKNVRRHFGRSSSRREKCKNRACIYKCGDVSEMTLISNAEQAPVKEECIFQEED